MADAGWYQDPDGAPGVLRWFDGSAWTEHRAAPPAETSRVRLDGIRWALVGSWVLGLVSLVLPWISATAFTVSVSAKGIDTGDGKSYGIIIIIAGASWVLSFARMGRSFLAFSLVAMIVLTGLAVYDIVHVTTQGLVNVGIGLYVAVAAGALGVIAGIVETRRRFARP